MATPRHGLNAQIWIDTSSAGTFTAGTLAAGTANLERIGSKNSWSLDMSRDFVDVTSFGDTTKTQVAGLPSASGDIGGNWDSTGTLIYNLTGATTERAIMVFPDATNNLTTWFAGKAFFSAKASGSNTSAVGWDLHFEAGPTGITWYHP